MCPLWWRLMSVRPSVCSSEHTPAEVRPAPPSWHANHDAPRHCSGAAHRSTQPRLLCPVLHLQPTTVRQSAAGAADDALPVTSRIYCDSRVCFCTSHPLAAGPGPGPHAGPYSATRLPSAPAGLLLQLFRHRPLVWPKPADSSLTEWRRAAPLRHF